MNQTNEIQINWKRLAQAINFKPTAKQRYILEHLNNQNTIVGGKRVGKTYLAAFIGLIELLKSKRTVWVVAPTYELAKRIWDPVFMWRNKYLDKVLKPNIQQFEMRNMMTGSIMKFKSADNPVQLKGEGLDLVIGDEVGDWKDGIWHEYIAPNVSQLRPSGDYGKAFLIGNANYFGSGWHKLITDKGYNKFSYHLPTAYRTQVGDWRSNNPEIITHEKLAELFDATPEKEWRQNYLAEFVPGQGVVFSNILECARGLFEDPKPNRFYYIGIDIGRLQDFTVITVVDSKTFNVVYWERFKDIEYPFQKKRILEVIKRYGAENTKAMVDQTGLGQPIVDDLAREGINIEGYTLTNQSKKDIIEKLSILMQQRKITYPEISELIQELQVFSYKVSETNKVQYNAPHGYHDDAVVSLALAVFSLQGDPELKDRPKLNKDEAVHNASVSRFKTLMSKDQPKRVSITRFNG